MKEYIKILFVFLFVSGIVAQDFILTSDDSVDILKDDGRAESIPGETVSLGSFLKAPSNPSSQSIQIFGGSFGNGGGNIRDNVGDGFRPNSPPKDSGKGGKASFGQPNQEAQAQKQKKPNLNEFGEAGLAKFSQAENSLRSAKWIYPGIWPSKKVVFMTPCFHNPCPNGQYTLYIKATCKFTVYLVDQNGNHVQKLGSGYAWDATTIKFFTPCGKYKIKIVLSCTCFCPYVCFNLVQDRENCFLCSKDPSNDFYLTYNPQTCQCQCASTCQDCKPPQIWYKFPTCRCGCPKSLICPPNQYFDKKACKCKCLPKCCPAWPYKSCGC